MLALSTATLGAAGDPVSVHVNPTQSENCALEIVVDSEDFYRSSRVELEGARVRRSHGHVLALIAPPPKPHRAPLGSFLY